MTLSASIAQHLRAVFFGGNWTSVNLKDSVADLDWQQATTQLYSLNTIAGLVYHIGYYVDAIAGVLRGGTLAAKDKYSFDAPAITSQADWHHLLEKVWHDAEHLAALVEQLPDSQLQQLFVQPKYGTYHRNLHGLIEHTHYHLGQIVLLRKLLNLPSADNSRATI
ncbi:DinB family protein [Hymenobacter wooponensis]|uniref:DinB family protein n=1 Tax=Hymenobacter wooponensis TaxID=1525360 RepID=A0A4Z0MS64_9BACT|nr:DinB family protein [Hymenobacter wooponensis]TGD82511.1 DinB family protein [Hymenobacter wooponensis]